MAHRDWEFKPDVIEDGFERVTGKQLAYIEQLQSDLGKPSDVNLLFLSRKEAHELIHDLHLEWLRSRRDAK